MIVRGCPPFAFRHTAAPEPPVRHAGGSIHTELSKNETDRPSPGERKAVSKHRCGATRSSKWPLCALTTPPSSRTPRHDNLVNGNPWRISEHSMKIPEFVRGTGFGSKIREVEPTISKRPSGWGGPGGWSAFPASPGVGAAALTPCETSGYHCFPLFCGRSYASPRRRCDAARTARHGPLWKP